jgi:CPA2 family monovalent cation:H+ antiporter-2
MEVGLLATLFFILAAAAIGGLAVKFIKLQPLIGYILVGMILGSFLPGKASVEKLAEIGIILLLFSVGLELSLSRLSRVFRIATLGATIQIILVTLISYFVLLSLGMSMPTALVLSLGFSLSSTAVVVKILSDRGEMETIHAEVMIGWLLVQDLAVIPMMVLLPVLARLNEGGLVLELGKALGFAAIVVSGVIFLGRMAVPFLTHQVAGSNSRELLVISAVALALGTAYLGSFFGISPALGAFLAGVVISETQENHAIFAETRPLRDLFVALFFVTLGFLVTPSVIINNFWLILSLTAFILILKATVIFLLSLFLGYRGKIAVATGLGLAQVGEFSFILFSVGKTLGLLSFETTSIGITTTLMTLILTPLFFKSIVPVWRKLRVVTKDFPQLNKAFTGWGRKDKVKTERFKNHIIICGYGRVGSWVGKALDSMGIPFVVIDYNQKKVQEVRMKGIPVIYGDPAEPEILDYADIRDARAIVVAIPDRVIQEEVVTRVQTVAPGVKIISRVHFDEDWERLKTFKVDKIIQPEFEAALAIVRSILASFGKSKEEVAKKLKSLRQSHSRQF